MGSHVAFKHRYPSNFELYTENDYLNRPENQREIIAQYDNSVIYNDFIADSIIKLFESKDALVIYFSDHSIDLFDSSDTYYGHARPNNQLSVNVGKEIPFWIFVTDTFKQRHPDIIEKIQMDCNQSLCTDMLYEKIMYLLELKEVGM